MLCFTTEKEGYGYGMKAYSLSDVRSCSKQLSVFYVSYIEISLYRLVFVIVVIFILLYISLSLYISMINRQSYSYNYNIGMS